MLMLIKNSSYIKIHVAFLGISEHGIKSFLIKKHSNDLS